MKVSNTTTKLLAILIALGALAVVWSVWSTGRASAAGGGVWKTGMFGIARGQTARINAVYLGDSNQRPVQLEMMFVDAMGNVAGWSKLQELVPGKAAFFDTSFEIPTQQRAELRAVANPIGDSNIRRLKFTAEVFDNDTFKTTLFLPGDLFED